MASELRFPHVNNLVLSGRLTRDVELRYTSTGTPVAKLPIAFDRNYMKNGEWQTETSFIDVIVWNKRGEQCAESLHKGNAIIVEGYIKTRSYTDSNGQNRKITEIVANKISFLERTNITETIPKADKNQELDEPSEQITDDDVPF